MIRSGDDESSSEDELREVTEVKKEDKWDCESILCESLRIDRVTMYHEHIFVS